MSALIKNAAKYLDQIAILSGQDAYTYRDLYTEAHQIASMLLAGKTDLQEARVAFMVSPGFYYVATQWGIWLAGGIAVPLCISYPLPSLKYVIDDTQAQTVIASVEFEHILEPLALENLKVIGKFSASLCALPEVAINRKAMILYTSGTTSLPKGVVTSHLNIEAQIASLVAAWQWSPSDHILCVLPLHHIHGIINVISCALWVGAKVEFLPAFSAEGIFKAFNKGKINLFMAVPTIYYKLIAYWESLPMPDQQTYAETMQKFRLMVSGSAALPISVMERWQQISGHRLLERYGMTEIGMGISNPYIGERKAGYIGMPLVGVGVRLVADDQTIIENNEPGEIQIKGDTVFIEYWQRPEATVQAFTADGWFKTGDIAQVENGYFKILGRDSVDIIKSGGYKISALEIEEVLRTFPNIEDCSVVGIPDQEWGELVAAVLRHTQPIDIEKLNTFMRQKMPAYKTPRLYKSLKELPRNAMGKVTKNELKKLFDA